MNVPLWLQLISFKTKLSAMLLLRLVPHSCTLRMCNFFRFQTSCHETRKRKETELEMLTGTIEGWEEEVIWYWQELLWDCGPVTWPNTEVLTLHCILDNCTYIEQSLYNMTACSCTLLCLGWIFLALHYSNISCCIKLLFLWI